MNIEINQSPKSQSVTGVSWQAFNRGEISRDVLETSIALNIPKSLCDHPIRTYPKIIEEVRNYVLGRSNGATEYQPALAKRNGDWLFFTRHTHTENVSDFNLLVWAREINRHRGIESGVLEINAHLQRYESLDFDYAYMNLALCVQAKDSNDRQSLERR